MKSKAHIKSHPIHPILVGFPIAFFTAAVGTEIVFLFTADNFFSRMSFYLELMGIAFALLAAVPGIIDYRYTLPPKSSAKKRGLNHALLNSTAVIIFSIAVYAKFHDSLQTLIILIIEVIGLILLSIAGWMGGTLAYRNQAGVDVRYASAGKWKEITVKVSTGEIDVAPENELLVNQMLLVRSPLKRIVLARTEKGYVAFDDRCPHKGGPLCGGSMMGGIVQCPWHGSQFDVENGTVKAGPAKDSIETYVTTLKGGRVFVSLH